jgi:hypothetical protein
MVSPRETTDLEAQQAVAAAAAAAAIQAAAAATGNTTLGNQNQGTHREDVYNT